MQVPAQVKLWKGGDPPTSSSNSALSSPLSSPPRAGENSVNASLYPQLLRSHAPALTFFTADGMVTVSRDGTVDRLIERSALEAVGGATMAPGSAPA